MQDKIGVPLEVGDTVIYAKSQGEQLHFATIEEIFDDKRVKIRNTKTKRVSQNSRYSTHLLSIETIKDSHPEYFI
jgi:hypothetical protein